MQRVARAMLASGMKGGRMAEQIARKLRLTSALLGTVTRKDLAAAFRRINPETAFDLGRADKWLQGRAQPRQLSVYDDWSKLLDIGQSGAWIAQSDLPSFMAAICARHGIDRTELERRAGAQFEPSAHEDRSHGVALAGTYACYSHALSPYYRGQLIRGSLSIEAGPGTHGLSAVYREALPTGPLLFGGSVTLAKRGLYANLREAGGDGQLFFCLFPPSQPGSVLGGYLCGTTVIDPEPHPSLTRILMIRLRNPASHDEWGGYLQSGQSIAGDLASLGLSVEEPQALDRQLAQFLAGRDDDGASQISPAEFRAILDVFDRHWLRHQVQG